MSALAAEPRFTAAEWSRIVSDPTANDAYQRVTRLGGSVRDYRAWKRREAAERSLDIYEGYLAALCIFLMQHHGDPTVDQVTEDMLMRAAEQHPDGSYKLVRTAYRGFFQWAEDRELVHRSPAKRMPRARPHRPQVDDVFTPAEQAQLLKATDLMPAPWVQRLRVECFIDLGGRSNEMRLLQNADVDVAARVVVIRHGKGDKQRVVPFGDGFFRAYVAYRNRPIPRVVHLADGDRWLEDRQPRDDDHLFFPYGFHKSSGRVTWADPSRALADRSIRSWWDKVVETAGVRYRSLHMNRHTLGTNLSEAGEGIETIGDWLGHEDLKTTKRYVHNARNRLQRGRGRLDDWRKAQGE